jgi:hypothetical protein
MGSPRRCAYQRKAIAGPKMARRKLLIKRDLGFFQELPANMFLFEIRNHCP